MKKLILAAALLLLLPIQAMAILIYFDSTNIDVLLGDTFSVELLADIQDPVLGWGLDVGFDPTILSDPAVSIGSSWFPANSLDGDGLAGLAFPFPVSGSNTLLATLTFTTLDYGSSPLIASITPGDLTEGFPLVPPGGFAEVDFINSGVNVSAAPVPEPATILLLATGLLGVAGEARRRRRK